MKKTLNTTFRRTLKHTGFYVEKDSLEGDFIKQIHKLYPKYFQRCFYNILHEPTLFGVNFAGSVGELANKDIVIFDIELFYDLNFDEGTMKSKILKIIKFPKYTPQQIDLSKILVSEKTKPGLRYRGVI